MGLTSPFFVLPSLTSPVSQDPVCHDKASNGVTFPWRLLFLLIAHEPDNEKCLGAERLREED